MWVRKHNADPIRVKGTVLQVLKKSFFGPLEVPPYLLQYYTMLLQPPRIIVGDAEFEPRTSASEVWHTTNEPPHLRFSEFLFYESNSFTGHWLMGQCNKII